MMNDFFFGKKVFISGGTGFIGSRLCKYLIRNTYLKKLISYSRRWKDAEDLARELDDGRFRFINGDVRNKEQLITALDGIDYVIHGAAYKSLPSAEYNPLEATRVNVDGTINIIKASIFNNVDRVLFISTDKAAAATSLYGRTKALAESIIVSSNNLGDTRLSNVRYGNISHSHGAVIPLWHDLIQKQTKGWRYGEDDNYYLPITDPSMTRFWFNEDDAVEYVLRCLTEMQGGETFVPYLKSSTIGDLFKAFREYYDLEIFMDLIERAGEKYHETMIARDESYRTTNDGWTFIIHPSFHDWNQDYERKGRIFDGEEYTSRNASKYTVNELVDLI